MVMVKSTFIGEVQKKTDVYMFQKMGGSQLSYDLILNLNTLGEMGHILWILLKYGDGGDIGTFIYMYICKYIYIHIYILVGGFCSAMGPRPLPPT
jgi:hypothetical protein